MYLSTQQNIKNGKNFNPRAVTTGGGCGGVGDGVFIAIVNRPGVAGAVLQTALLLIN